MGLLIETTTWDTIIDFWRSNRGFELQKILQPIPLGDIQWTLKDNVFEWERSKVLVALDPITGLYYGCVQLLHKEYEGYKICGLGKMAVDYKYRRNHIGRKLLDVSIAYMVFNCFDISILWASVLKFYDSCGYVDIYKNMMVKYFTNIQRPKQYWIDSIKTLGTW